MKNLFLLLALITVSACSALPHVIEPVAGDTSEAANEIFVVDHGWHTGFVIPANSIQKHIPELKTRFGSIRYIELGWGDKGFYQSKEITSSLTMRAIFWPTDSVIHAVAVPVSPEKYFPYSQTERICVNGNGYAALMKFIENSFFKDKEGHVVSLKNGLYGNSQFYQGMGDYYLMNTCNKWTAKGLKSSGVDIDPMFKLTADSVMDVVMNSTRSQRNGGCAIVDSVKYKYTMPGANNIQTNEHILDK